MTAEDLSDRWILWLRERDAPATAQRRSLWERRKAELVPGAAMTGSVSLKASQGAGAVRPGHPVVAVAERDLVRRIVDERDVHIEFSPVKDVRRDQVVAFEAHACGPRGPLRMPDRLFAAAAAAGVAGQLDWIVRAAAFRDALKKNLPPAVSLFVTVQPDSLIMPCPEDLLETIWEASVELRIFIDIPGRSLSRSPYQVLETARRGRAAGWGIVVQGLEHSGRGIAMLPALEPDIVKIDQNVLTTYSGLAAGAVTAALAEIEHGGAALLVQNVADEPGRRVGRFTGAAYQSGPLMGPPAQLPAGLGVPMAPVARHDRVPGRTPWDTLADHEAHTVTHVRRDEVDNLVRPFIAQAMAAEPTPLIALMLPDALASMQPQTVLMLQMLMERSVLSLVLGRDVGTLPDWPARAADLPGGHPLVGQFCFAALSPTRSMVLVTKRDGSRDATVDLAVSHDPAATREIVRYVLELLDTLPGGIRYLPPG